MTAHRAAVPPRVIEIVGVAGSGKTSLLRALCSRSAFHRGEDIRVRRPSHLVRFVGSLPAVAARYSPGLPGRGLTWDEAKSVAYLARWHDTLRVGHAGGIIVLDQGPIFRLATLHAFGPPSFQHASASSWWRSMFERWSHLDLVVWLDADDEVLAARINARAQKHIVKAKPHDEILEFLHRHRTSYECVMARLLAAREFAVLRFDTTHTSTSTIAEAVTRHLQSIRPEAAAHAKSRPRAEA